MIYYEYKKIGLFKCNHAVTVYGHKINNDIYIYYHGLDRSFNFYSLRRGFNIPTSEMSMGCKALSVKIIIWSF